MNRKPTDDEWCSAAGKINMTCLTQCLEEGKAAKDKLVVSNLRMVQRVVNLYIRNGLGSEYNAGDMMQEGTMVRFILNDLITLFFAPFTNFLQFFEIGSHSRR